ncbi:hypothetical protein AB0K93_26085 [Streptomyces sp. NPDC052676]|uniref:hypothetical protein n=1 Tax=Streptomyces sp. NPDC052676 TaxID=3154953 RepID=UPI0034421996
MDEHRDEVPGRSADPVPRDLPDQQTREGEDPWDVPTGPSGPQEAKDEDASRGEGADENADVPDTDEAGTGRRDTPRPDDSGTGGTGTADEGAAPDESTG